MLSVRRDLRVEKSLTHLEISLSRALFSLHSFHIHPKKKNYKTVLNVRCSISFPPVFKRQSVLFSRQNKHIHLALYRLKLNFHLKFSFCLSCVNKNLCLSFANPNAVLIFDWMFAIHFVPFESFLDKNEVCSYLETLNVSVYYRWKVYFMNGFNHGNKKKHWKNSLNLRKINKKQFQNKKKLI